MQDDNPAASAARELKAAARDALRMGSQWAHHAIQWVDERRNDMNHRNREHEDRERTDRNRHSTSGPAPDEGDYRATRYGERHESSDLSGRRPGPGGYARSDRDVQGDDSNWQQGRGGSAGGGREGGDYASARQQYGQESRPYASSQRTAQHPDSQRHAAQEPGQSLYGAEGLSYGSRGYGARNERYGSQQDSRDYSQAGSPSGSRASRSAIDYGRQSGHGGYGREGYGGPWQQGRDYRASPGQWRAGDATGQGDEQGQDVSPRSQSGSREGMARATSYRGRGPKNYTRSDERIREDLNERLTDADDIDASGLSVEVNNGVATLTGTVDQRWMKHRAEDLAESCSGVRDVNNQIRVAPASSNASASNASGSQGATSGNAPGADTLSGSSAPQASSPMNARASGTSTSPASTVNTAGSTTSGRTGGSSARN